MNKKPKFNKYGMTQWYWLARYHKNLKLGENVQIGAFSVLDCEMGMTIEDDVRIGFGSKILTFSTVDDKNGPIILKRGCRIGANTVVMPNTTIGENSIIGANSFVNRSIPANEIWAGTPVKFIRKLKKEKKKWKY